MHKIDDDSPFRVRILKEYPEPPSSDGNPALGIVIGLVSAVVFYGSLILWLRSC